MKRPSAKGLLQTAVALGGVLPVAAGGAGILNPMLLDLTAWPQTSTHTAYLSGLLLGIGLGFWSTIPKIEHQGGRFALLTAIVAVGGLARLLTAIRLGVWTYSVTGPLVMELAVTPALWLWQRQVARKPG